MTDAEKDAVWRLLPDGFKKEVSRHYKSWFNSLSFEAECAILDYLFGKHNLTASEEEKPRETDIDGKFHCDDNVITTAYCPLYGKGWIGTVVQCHESDVDVAFGLRVIPHIALCDLAPYTEEQEPPLKASAAEGLIQMAKDEMGIVDNDTPKANAPNWLAYRMELAKEVATALIAKGHNLAFLSESTSLIVNGIIKRLKGGK